MTDTTTDRITAHGLAWRGRTVRWWSGGAGAPVVLCHGTPWSAALWMPFAEALAAHHRVYLWDMPGYGQSSMSPEHDVSLGTQGELFAHLLQEWGLDRPHVVAHDYGGAVALRAHLVHGRPVASLALVDVVALAPWGSPFFRLVAQNADVFAAVPPAVHEGIVRAYVRGASHRGLRPEDEDRIVAPWLTVAGQAAFYRQIEQADERWTDEVEPLYRQVDVPVQIVWGAEDSWIPVDRAHRLHAAIGGSRLAVLPDAGHLVQLDQPVALSSVLTHWLAEQTRP